MRPARSKLIVILILLTIGLIIIVSLAYFIMLSRGNLDGQSPFGDLTAPLDDTDTTSLPLPTPPEDWQIYEGPDPPNNTAETFMNAYSAGNIVPPADSWNWQESMVYARIMWMNAEENSLLLSVTEPEGLGIFSDQFWTRIECAPGETTSFLSLDMRHLDSNFNLIERILTGEWLYTYCLNESCSSIGKACVLIR